MIVGDPVAYWSRRWLAGPECPGSVGEAARAKAKWVNDAVVELGVRSVVDWGCGDGGQARLLTAVEFYVGVDVARSAVERAGEVLGERPGRVVVLAEPGWPITVRADLALSMDVVFHLTDPAHYREWLARLCASGDRFLAVHGTDYDSPVNGHMRHHRWTADLPPEWRVTERPDYPDRPGWYLAERVPGTR